MNTIISVFFVQSIASNEDTANSIAVSVCSSSVVRRRRSRTPPQRETWAMCEDNWAVHAECVSNAHWISTPGANIAQWDFPQRVHTLL